MNAVYCFNPPSSELLVGLLTGWLDDDVHECQNQNGIKNSYNLFKLRGDVSLNKFQAPISKHTTFNTYTLCVAYVNVCMCSYCTRICKCINVVTFTQYWYLEKWLELSEQCRHHHHVQPAFKINYRDRIEIDCPAFVYVLVSVWCINIYMRSYPIYLSSFLMKLLWWWLDAY